MGMGRLVGRSLWIFACSDVGWVGCVRDGGFGGVAEGRFWFWFVWGEWSMPCLKAGLQFRACYSLC